MTTLRFEHYVLNLFYHVFIGDLLNFIRTVDADPRQQKIFRAKITFISSFIVCLMVIFVIYLMVIVLIHSELLTPTHAAIFATVCGSSGLALLLGCCPFMTGVLGATNLVLYTAVYTPSKRMTIANTWIGALGVF